MLKEGSSLVSNALFNERFSSIDALLQGVDPRVKIISFLTIILISAISHNITTPLAVIALSIALASISKVPLSFFIPRVLIFIPLFALVIVLPLPFITPGSQVLAGSLGPLQVAITREGLYTATAFTIRVWACVSMTVLLVLTTNFLELLKAMEKLGTPKVFIRMISVTYRYIFFFFDMVYRMFVAIELRTVKGGAGWKPFTNLGALFIRSYEEGERVSLAMRSRGFQGEVKAATDLRLKKLDTIFAAFSFAFSAFIVLVGFAL